jgi:tRNA-dihydrouridine synthase B
MISAEAITRGQQRTIRMIDSPSDEHPVGVQLFGSNPETMAKAVKLIGMAGFDLVDLNLGCPVKKVTKKNGGAALLKNLTLAGEVISSAVENSPKPITIKIRSGWEKNRDIYLELGKKAEKLGISAIALHPRSGTQGYRDKSDWSKIANLKKEVAIPVVGNGDVRSPEDARDMFDQTGCDAIMIGRAAMKNPYIFKRIKCFLKDGRLIPDQNISERISLALKHTRMMVGQFGETSGILMMRKHLAWYTKGLRGGAEIRNELKKVCSYNDAYSLLSALTAKRESVANG